MLEKLKKSRTGQAVILAFTVASIAVAMVVWMYESIRIPTLNTQVAFRDDKVKSVEADLQKERDKTAAAQSEVKQERSESSKWKTSADQAASEIADLSRKLRDSQSSHAKALQELNEAKAKQATQTNQIPLSTDPNFEQKIRAVADHQETTFLLLDKILTELRLTAYARENTEYEAITAKPASTLQELKPYAERLGLVVRQYWEFRITLEALRFKVMQRVLEDDYSTLMKSEKTELNQFLSSVRHKPLVLSEVEALVTKLKAVEDANGWNSNSMKAVEAFMSSDKLASAAK